MKRASTWVGLVAVALWVLIGATPRPSTGTWTGTGKITSACVAATGVITLPSTPKTASVQLFINGIEMTPTEDYTISGAVITPVAANSNWCLDPATVVSAFYQQ